MESWGVALLAGVRLDEYLRALHRRFYLIPGLYVVFDGVFAESVERK
jgi:hypothetical protein